VHRYNSLVARLPFDDHFRERVSEHLARFDRRAIAPDVLTRAAVAVTLVGDSAGEASFILTRRPLNLRRHAGQWALPGGRCDDGENTIDAARREVEEEVGLSLGRESAVGRLDDFQTRSGFLITPVVFFGPSEPALRPDPNEVHAAYVVPLSVLEAPGVPTIQESATSEHPLISIKVESLGTTIWAPTAALLYQTREVVVHGRSTRVAHFEQPRFAWK